MSKSPNNPKVDTHINQLKLWQEETEALRNIILECGLTEELKWGKPCYTFQGKNIAVIQGFKAYFALLFFKGYLLKDTNGILVKMGDNTKVGRQARFANVKEITDKKTVIKAYIREAIEVEKVELNA